jgi:predicted aspartyl protease
MGTFSVTLEVGNQAGDSYRAVEALVDTGATYTVLPGRLLRDLGVAPHRTSTFELADGSQHEWQMGRTWVRLGGKQEMTLVVFGDGEMSPILGAVTLEEFLLAPDPVRKALMPVSGLLVTLRRS